MLQFPPLVPFDSLNGKRKLIRMLLILFFFFSWNMSLSKDSGSGIAIPMLEGSSNYHVWVATIQSFLITFQLWTVASGTSTCPTIEGPDYNAWIASDYQAVGIISLYIKEDLRTAIVQTYEDPIISCALRTLANLARLHATTGLTGQFYLLKNIVNWRLRGRDPSAEINHLTELFNWLSGTKLVLPDTLRAMLLCTGLGDNYENFITNAFRTISLTDFTTAKLIPMILAESKRQSTYSANRIVPSSYSNTSIRCKICRGSSHETEKCWRLTGKPGSKLSGNQTNTQQPQQQRNSGNQGSDGKHKGNRRGKGKKDKGKGKTHGTHIPDTDMIINISKCDSSHFEDLGEVSITSDKTWTPEYNTSNLLPGKPGEASTSAVTASWIEEEVLDWQNDTDAWEKAYTPPKPSYRRHSFQEFYRKDQR